MWVNFEILKGLEWNKVWKRRGFKISKPERGLVRARQVAAPPNPALPFNFLSIFSALSLSPSLLSLPHGKSRIAIFPSLEHRKRAADFLVLSSNVNTKGPSRRWLSTLLVHGAWALSNRDFELLFLSRWWSFSCDIGAIQLSFPRISRWCPSCRANRRLWKVGRYSLPCL